MVSLIGCISGGGKDENEEIVLPTLPIEVKIASFNIENKINF